MRVGRGKRILFANVTAAASLGAQREETVAMAKGPKREYVWLECKECGDRNYRTQVNVSQGNPKLELKKFCKREGKRTVHKLRRK